MPHAVNTITDKDFRVEADGKKVILDNFMSGCQATVTTPRWDVLNKNPREPLGLDIEFQEAKRKGHEKWSHRMGRVALVNTRGVVVLDVYVRYPFDQDLEVKMPPRRYNVSWRDLQLRYGARTSGEVEGWLHDIVKDRLIIGSGMRLDLTAVGENVWQENHAIFDCQHTYGQVKLVNLAARYLEDTFNWHDPADDARMAMLLWLRLNPYEDRTSFKDPPFRQDVKCEEEFPTLAAAASMEKN